MSHVLVKKLCLLDPVSNQKQQIDKSLYTLIKTGTTKNTHTSLTSAAAEAHSILGINEAPGKNSLNALYNYNIQACNFSQKDFGHNM